MKDKRIECGCHPDCQALDGHTCEKPCRFPACLNEEEKTELRKRLEEMGW